MKHFFRVIASPYRDHKIALYMKTVLAVLWLFWLVVGILNRGLAHHYVLLAMILILCGDILLTHNHPCTPADAAVFAVLAGLQLYLFLTGAIGYFSLFPLLLFLTSAIFILGIRSSLVLNVIASLLVMHFFHGAGRSYLDPLYGTQFIVRLPYLYLCIVGIAYIVMYSIQNYWLEKDARQTVLQQRIDAEKGKLAEVSLQVITAMYDALSAKIPEVDLHCRQVAQDARRLAERMNLPEKSCSDAYYAGLMHEVGAVGLPDAVLSHSDLSEEEFAVYKTYVERGSRIIRELQIANDVAEAVAGHRENFDGNGYPAGLAGESIPRIARIVAVTDYVDRHRRRGESDAVIGSKLQTQSGTRFDPACVNAACELLAK